MPCHAVLCGAVLGRAACFAALTLSYHLHASYHSKCHVRYRCYYARFVHTTLLNCKKCTPSSAQLSSAQLISAQLQLSYSSAAQRIAVWCHVVPCLTLRCGAVPCCAFVRTYCTRYHAKYKVPGIMRSTRYQVPVCTCVLVFLFSLFDCSLGSHAFVLLANYTRIPPITTWHRQQAQSTAQGHELCRSSSWHYQIVGCTKSWASSFCPLPI